MNTEKKNEDYNIIINETPTIKPKRIFNKADINIILEDEELILEIPITISINEFKFEQKNSIKIELEINGKSIPITINMEKRKYKIDQSRLYYEINNGLLIFKIPLILK